MSKNNNLQVTTVTTPPGVGMDRNNKMKRNKTKL